MSMQVAITGYDLLHNPRRNKGTAFTYAERRARGIEGLLPPASLTIELQVARCARQRKMWRRNNHVPDGSRAWIAFNEPQRIVWVMQPRPIDLDSVRLCAMSNDVFAAKNASEGLKERGLTNKRKRGFVSRNAWSENEFSCHDPLATPNEK